MAVLFDKKSKTYYVDSKIKRADGSWYHFKYKEINNQDFKSKRYVQSIEAEIIRKKKVEICYQPSSKVQNVSDLIESYINYRENELAFNTKANNFLRAKKYIEPYFENSLLKLFNPANLASFRIYLSSLKICAEYMNNIIAITRDLIRYARILGLINSDQKDDCLVPLIPIKKKVNEEKEARNKYTSLNDLTKLLSVIDNKNDYDILKLLYFSGLRLGEFLGIEVNDIEFSDDFAIITIKRQRLKNGAYTNQLKTSASYKKIAFAKTNAEILKEYIKRNDFKEYDKIFPFSGETLRKKLDKYSKLANLPHNTLHGYGRKSINTELYKAGADTKVRTTLLGQISMSVNENNYVDNQSAFDKGLDFIKSISE